MADSTTQAAPAYVLRVIQPFGDYIRGDSITDTAEAQAVLAGENAPSVVKIGAVSVVKIAAAS